MAGKGKGKSKQQTVAPPFSKRDWAKKHREATVVDAHAHPTVKAALLGRFFRRANKQNPEATLKTRSYRGFNPFVSRTAFPMLQQGGADVLLTAAYAPEAAILPAYLGPRWLVNLVTRLPLLNGIRRKYLSPTYFQATLTMMAALQTAVDQYNDFAKAQNQKSGPPKRRFVEIVPTVTRLEEIVQMESDPPIALIHSVEGAHSLHGDLAGNTLKIVETYHAQGVIDSQAQIDLEIMDNLQDLYDAGVACLTLAHFYPNLVAAPCFPYPGYALKYMDLLGDQDKERIHHDLTQGLTPIGEKVVRRMLHLGMLIDLTHCTPAARNRVYQIADEVDANYRVIASHVGVQAINPDPMNLADWEIEWIARRIVSITAEILQCFPDSQRSASAWGRLI